MIINKNKPIQKGFVFLKKRFLVVLTLSNGFFIHLLGCNAHQVSNECAPSERFTLGQINDYGIFFNKPSIESLPRSVIKELNNVYKLLYERIDGSYEKIINKEPKQLIYDIQDLTKQWKFRILEKKEDLLKILLKKFCDVVNQMNLVNHKLYDTDVVIRELDLLGKGFYEAYYGVNAESSKGYRSSDDRRSDLKRLYKAVEEGHQKCHSPKNKEPIIQEIDLLYQIFKIFYKLVQEPRINPKKTMKILYKAYQILCEKICKCDVQALNMDMKPQQLLSDIKNLIQIRLNKLDQLPKEIDDFLRNSSIMFDPREVNRARYDDWQRSTKAVYNILGVNVSTEPKSDKKECFLKRKKKKFKLFSNKKSKFDETSF